MEKIIDNFMPFTGRHCITNSLRQIFRFNSFEISEAMLFGLGSGLSWFYMENKATPYPIISGRTKPLDFEQSLSDTTGIKIEIKKTSSLKKAYLELKSMLESNQPVMMYVDMACLSYLNMPEDAHFGGHSILVFGIDEEEGIAYVSDRDGKDNALDVNGKILNNDFYKVPLDELAAARNSKYPPFPAQNKWLEFDFTGFVGVTCDIIMKALQKNLDELLNPPIKNLSISGIEKFSNAISNWKHFDDKKLKGTALNCFFMIDEKGGTGGAAFRKLYAEFLDEASLVCNNQTLKLLSDDYLEITKLWDELSKGLWQLFEKAERTLLSELSNILKTITLGEYDIVQKMKRYVYNL